MKYLIMLLLLGCSQPNEVIEEPDQLVLKVREARVAGYSAYFVDLSTELQEEIIRRTEHSVSS